MSLQSYQIKNKPFGSRPLHPHIHQEVVASIQLRAEQSKSMATKIEWADGSERVETYIHHQLDERQQAFLTKLIEVNKDKILTTGLIPLGKAQVSPFILELYEGGELRLAKKNQKLFLLKDHIGVLLEKCMKEMEEAGVGQFNPQNLLHASPASFQRGQGLTN